MKKSIVLLLMLILMAFGFVACTPDADDNGMLNDEQSFQATILEIDDSGLLLEPLEGEDILRSGDRVMVGPGNLEEDSYLSFEEGDEVLVTFSGGVMESYPLQLEKVISIEPLE